MSRKMVLFCQFVSRWGDRAAHAHFIQRPPRGQGMTEYIVVVAVVAVAAIGVYSMLGQTIRNQTAGIAQEISGNDAGAALNAATSSASAARTQANVRKDLKNYNQDNH